MPYVGRLLLQQPGESGDGARVEISKEGRRAVRAQGGQLGACVGRQREDALADFQGHGLRQREDLGP